MISPKARTRLGWLACALATLAGALAAVAVSGAAEERAAGITIQGDENGITVSGGEARDVVTFERATGVDAITISSGTFDIQRAGCEEVQTGRVVCDAADAEVLEALLRDGNDTLAFLGGGLKTLTISGLTGPGDDKLLSKKGAQSLQGGKGEDNLNAGLGDDTLAGGPDPDVLQGGKGDDECDDSRQDTTVKGCES
jgi:Ca2+-binding RTX toxin-like protein